MDERVIYRFKKDYVCNMGKINEGREVTYFNKMLHLDGIIIPEPFATDIKNLFNDKNFVKEYINEVKIIKNKV